MKERKQGKTLSRVAKEVGISIGYLSTIIRGGKCPSPEILRRLSKALGAPYSMLLIEAGYIDETRFREEIRILKFLEGARDLFARKYFNELKKQRSSPELTNRYKAITCLLSVAAEAVLEAMGVSVR